MEAYLTYEPIALAVVTILGIIAFIYNFVLFPNKGGDRPRKSDYRKESPDDALWEASQQGLDLDLMAQDAKERMEKATEQYREEHEDDRYSL